MPPIRIKKFSNEITKGIARDNNVHMLYHIHRRQEDFNNNHKINPTSVPSIPTVSLPHGPISLTLVTTSTINATPAAGTDIDTATPIASATDTDTEATATDIGDLLPTDPSTPKIPKIPFPSIPPSITTPITSDIPTTAYSDTNTKSFIFFLFNNIDNNSNNNNNISISGQYQAQVHQMTQNQIIYMCGCFQYWQLRY
ncbi:unnamed protein product [Rhizophagus irregularis]|nr:unnamed protein product [Rhizophagus irregularis]